MSSDDDFVTDHRRMSLASPPPPQSSGGYAPDSPKFENQADSATNGEPHTTPSEVASTDDQVRKVLYSDIGVSVLLNRLKQGVATAKELATVFKKRALIEDEHGKSLQKLARSTQETLKRLEVKQQGFNRSLYQATRAWDESTTSSLQFASQLHLMCEELTELSKVVDRKRKSLKHDALRDETNVTIAEQIADKVRAKHDSLAEDLERAISASRGETLPPSKGRFGMGRKSGTQLIKQEEELRSKRVEAEREMHNKTQIAMEMRRELVSSMRPRNIKALVDLVTETESGLSFHLQKFATLSESLAANQGQALLPLGSNKLGFAALIGQINDGKDFRDYVLEFSTKIPPLNRYSNPQSTQPPATYDSGTWGRSQPPQLPDMDTQIRGDINQDVQRAAAPSNGQYLPPQTFQSVQDRQYPTGPPSMPNQQQPYSTPVIPSQPPQLPYTNYPPSNTSAPYLPDSSVQPTPSTAFSPQSFSPTPPPERATPTQAYSAPQRQYEPSPKPSTPKGRTFGVPLDVLINRENATLPLIVAQCVIAIDQFGLDVEGIYRKSGSASTIAKLKQFFDFEPEVVDFRTESGFFGDIHAVAGILKQFLRELPEPLLTRAFYPEFVRVSAIEQDFHRRDAIHSLVNDLPDANYSCIRTLALHLNKIAEHADQNKMTVQNLASVLGPTLLAPEGAGMEETGAQIRVAETIITFAKDMFELEEE